MPVFGVGQSCSIADRSCKIAISLDRCAANHAKTHNSLVGPMLALQVPRELAPVCPPHRRASSLFFVGLHLGLQVAPINTIVSALGGAT
jgi:hypothetical protein